MVEMLRKSLYLIYWELVSRNTRSMHSADFTIPYQGVYFLCYEKSCFALQM